MPNQDDDLFIESMPGIQESMIGLIVYVLRRSGLEGEELSLKTIETVSNLGDPVIGNKSLETPLSEADSTLFVQKVLEWSLKALSSY